MQTLLSRSLYHNRFQDGIQKPLNDYAGTYGAHLLHTVRFCEPEFDASRGSVFAAIPLTVFLDP